MEEGPTRTDQTVTNARTTTNEMRTLRKCGCGWEKTTTLMGLRIHMGKMKCGGGSRKQPCIAQERAGQTNGIQSRVENHSAIGPNVAVVGQEEREGKERDADDTQGENPVAPPSNPRVESSQGARSLKSPGHKNRIQSPTKLRSGGSWMNT